MPELYAPATGWSGGWVLLEARSLMKKIVVAMLFAFALGTAVIAAWVDHSLAQTGVGSSSSAPKGNNSPPWACLSTVRASPPTRQSSRWLLYVVFRPSADIAMAPGNVRFQEQSGHRPIVARRPRFT